MQEGILILKGKKVIFINGIFQNLSILNSLKQSPTIKGNDSLSTSYLDEKIFYIYSLDGEKLDFESDDQSND